MQRHREQSPTSSESKPKQGRAAGVLGCISHVCAFSGIISIVPFLGVKYNDWWSGGSGGEDAARIFSSFLWMFGNAVLVVGLILWGASLVVLRRSTGTWSATCGRWEFASLVFCAMSLVVSGVLASVGWLHS